MVGIVPELQLEREMMLSPGTTVIIGSEQGTIIKGLGPGEYLVKVPGRNRVAMKEADFEVFVGDADEPVVDTMAEPIEIPPIAPVVDDDDDEGDDE